MTTFAQTPAVGSTAPSTAPSTVPATLRVNGTDHALDLDPRTTLLDALRERLGLTGSKKGCDRGQCGACTVLVDGRRTLACLTLALAATDIEIRTVEGLATSANDGPNDGPNGDDERLHPLQSAFLEHDAYQCGYCTPGQLCSAVGMLDELAWGWPSAVTADVGAAAELTEAEVRERMSGNLCRCGAYAGIVAAILDAGSPRRAGTVGGELA